MSLSTTWGAHNRVVDEELRTVFSRDTLVSEFSGHKNYYFKYLRQRTKSYKYVGLTKSAAIACAAALNDLYNRICLDSKVRQLSSSSQGVYGLELYFTNGFDDVTFDPPTQDLPRYDQLLAYRYLRKKCGEATPRYSGESDAYDVIVNVNEELETYFIRDAADPDIRNSIWFAFESDPGSKQLRFCGLDHPNNEKYDDDEIGYGSPDGGER